MVGQGLRLGPVPQGQEDAYLRLEDQSARAYNRFVYRDADVSERIRRHLFRQGVAEFAPPHGAALLEDDRLVGMTAYLGGERLKKIRLRGAMTLRRTGLLPEEGGVVRRLKKASGATLDPEAGDFYLSRVAVAREERGRGLGSLLLDRYEEAGTEWGADRLVLDVDARSEAAVSFYRRAGYDEIGRDSATDGEQTLTYLHMSKRPP